MDADITYTEEKIEMASIIVTGPELDATLLSDPAFDAKLKAGMLAFGTKFHELYSNTNNKQDVDALIETFMYIETLTTPVHKIYAISPGGPTVYELSSPVYSDDESQILFKIKGKARPFRITIRQDKKFSMNVSMPIFTDPTSYLVSVVNGAQLAGTTTPAIAAKFLLANSLISRCK